MSDKKLSQAELEFGERVDRCLADGLVKFGSGIGIGLVASLLFFRSKSKALKSLKGA